MLFTDLRIRRLGIVIDAGVGKSTALSQLQNLVHNASPNHLVIDLKMRDLPLNSPCDLLDGENIDDLETVLVKAMHDYLRANQKTQVLPADTDCFRRQLKNWLTGLARVGDLTLTVDAVDQIALSELTDRCNTLGSFLGWYPKIRLVVAARPYAFGEVLKRVVELNVDAISSDQKENFKSWVFCTIDRFNRAEVREYLDEKWEWVKYFEAEEQGLPRTLNAIREMTVDEMTQVVSKSDLFYIAIFKSLRETLSKKEEALRQSTKQPSSMLEVVSMVAFAMWCMRSSPVTSLVDDGGNDVLDFHNFVKGFGLRLHTQRNESLNDAIRSVSTVDTELIRIRYYDQDDRIASIEFADSTTQSFLASYWVSNFLAQLPESKRVDLQNMLCIRVSKIYSSVVSDFSYGEYFQEFWQFVAGMSGSAFEHIPPASHNDSWSIVMRLLFEPSSQRRPTELMYRAWPTLLRRGGFIDRSELTDLTRAPKEKEALIRFATCSTQSMACNNFAYGIKRFSCSIQQVVFDFLFSYLDLQSRGDKDVRLLENSFVELKTDPEVSISRFAVWQSLYGKFDGSHSSFPFQNTRSCSPPRKPVVFVTFFDAWAFSTWANSCIPDLNHYVLADAGSSDYPVWAFESSRGKGPRKVNVGTPNRIGLFHVRGNVHEWTSNVGDWPNFRRTHGGCYENGETSLKRDGQVTSQEGIAIAAKTVGFRVLRQKT